MGLIRKPVWDPAFEEFAAARAALLLRTAVFLTGDRDAAEDLVQTALLRTALRWRRAQDNPDAYIRQVLVNLTRDSWRTRRRRVQEVPLQPDDDPGAAFSDYRASQHRHSPEAALADRDELLDALRQLPSRQRAAVVLRYWEDLSVAQNRGVHELQRGHGQVVRQPRAGTTTGRAGANGHTGHHRPEHTHRH